MRIRHIVIFSATVLAGALAGSLVGPRPAEAVARELIELQRDVTSLLQGQKDLSTQVTQDNTVMKTLIGQSGDNVNRLAPEIRPGRPSQFRRAPRHHVHASPGSLRQSRGNQVAPWQAQSTARRSSEYCPEPRCQNLRRRSARSGH